MSLYSIFSRTVSFGVAVFLLGTQTLMAADLEISEFRFGHHGRSDFERLVLQFKKRSNDPAPNIKVLMHPSGQEATVYLERGNFVGAIPEAAINESYTKRSSYLGPLSVSTDNPAMGTSVRVFLKGTNLTLDPFWLEGPSRLVIDAYPPGSLRAQGRNVPTGSTSRVAHKPRPSGGSRGLASKAAGDSNPVICFPANAKLQAKITFQMLFPSYGGGADTSDDTHTYPELQTIGAVVCYPKDAQVAPVIGFQTSQRAIQAPDRQGASLGVPMPTAPAPGFGMGFGSLPPSPRPPALAPPPPAVRRGGLFGALPPRPTGGTPIGPGRGDGQNLPSVPPSLFQASAAPSFRLGGENPNTSLGQALPAPQDAGRGPSSYGGPQQQANPGFLLPPTQ